MRENANGVGRISRKHGEFTGPQSHFAAQYGSGRTAGPATIRS